MLLLLVLLIPLIQVSALELSTEDRGSVVIKQFDNPAKFKLSIRSVGVKDTCEIYSLVSVKMTPTGTFDIEAGKTNVIEIGASPSKRVRNDIAGFYIFEYQVKCRNDGISKANLRVKIVDLNDVLSIDSSGLKPGDEELTLLLKNLENTHLENLDINFKSEFFNYDTKVSLAPLGNEVVTIPVNVVALQKKTAGRYPVILTVKSGDNEVEIVRDIEYLEKGALAVSEIREGFLVRKTEYKKTNEGNIPIVAEITDTKGLIGRLFTSHNPNPQSSESKGFSVVYTWRQELAPGESIVASSKTNYTLPFVLLVLIVIVIGVVKFTALKPVNVRKSVSLVKTKGGELALRVRISVKARNHVDNLQIIDRVPNIMKLYDKFGIKPDKIDMTTRRLIWNLPQLNAGEERVYSYIAYATVKIFGKVELPATTAVFEKNGQTHEVMSNTAFLAAESGN